MTDKPEQPRYSDTQLAAAGLGAAVVLVVIIIAIALWNSMSG
jgi:uncharacterized membrane protein YkgB